MAAQVAAMIGPPEMSLKRGCETMLSGFQHDPGHSHGDHSMWDHYYNGPDFQMPKKHKMDVSIPPNFGNNIGWTAGPPMMELLSMRPDLQQPRMPNGDNLPHDQPRPAQGQPQGQRMSLHRRHQSVPVFPSQQYTMGSAPQYLKADQEDYNENLEDTTYFYGDLEEADERLSIGEVVWQAPEPAYVALPSTFLIAEGLAQFPPPKPASHARHTISKYITHDEANIKSSCCPIWQSADWHAVRDDPIFCDLSGILRSTVPQRHSTIDQCKLRRVMEPIEEEAEDKEAIRRAQDALIHALNSGSGDLHRQDSGRDTFGATKHDLAMHQAVEPPKARVPVKPNVGHRRTQSFNPQAQTFTAGHSKSASLVLQPAFDFRPSSNSKSLSKPGHNRARSQSPQRSAAFSLPGDVPVQQQQQLTDNAIGGHRSRSKSPERQLKPVVPEPKTFAVDSEQEDILARLGVTGKAQKAYATPGPALNPLSHPQLSRSPEQPNMQVPFASGPAAQAATARPQAFQPLQEVSANCASFYSAKKRGRSQSEDLDNSMKRPREMGFMHSGARTDIMSSGPRW